MNFSLYESRINRTVWAMTNGMEDIEEQPPDRIVGVVDGAARLRLTCRIVSSSAMARASGHQNVALTASGQSLT